MDEISDAAITPEIRAAALSVLVDRYQFLKRAGITFGGARDLYDVLGYLREISPLDYRDRYARGGLAARVVEAMPRATWRGGWELIEDENPKVSTEFEKTWDNLEQRLQVSSTLLKTDILAGQGRYAVLLIGTANDFSQELKKGNGPDKLLYLLPFSEEDATIQEWVTDTADPRFNLPKYYMLKRSTVGRNSSGMNFIKTVHWSHVIHVAEGTLDNEVFGQPTLERVWNLLDDLDKITGGGAEAFWLRANQGLQLDVDKTMTLSPAAEAALKAEVDEYRHNISRVMKTKGVTANALGSDVANFLNPADAVITQIAGARAIPKRILTGSEMGELASSQDRDNWKDQVNGRQTSYASPVIVRPFVDRLIKYGYLPTPKQYEVRWAQIQVLTEQEKAEGAKNWATTNQLQGTPIFLEEEIRDKWYGMEPLTPEQLAKATKAKEEAVAASTPIPPPEEEGAKDGKDGEEKEDEKKPAKKKASSNNKVVIEHQFKAGGAELRDLDHKFSSTQVNLPIRLSDVKIPVDYLAEDGRETDPHVTVKYGIHAQNPNGVRSILTGFGPVTLTLGKTSTFVNSDGYDVLYVAVESADLVRLNQLITDKLDTTNTTPSYIPHATIAYLHAGKAKSFVGLDTFEGQKYTVNQVVFSNVDGERTTIDLIEPARARAAEEPDAELLQVLEAAVQAGNTDVIDAIIGIRHAYSEDQPREPSGSSTGGQFASTTGTVTSESNSGGVIDPLTLDQETLFTQESIVYSEKDAATYRQLKGRLTDLNAELLDYIDDKARSPAALALIAEQQEIVKTISHLKADRGGLEGIKKPGGPRDVVVIGSGPGGMQAAIVAGTDGLDTLILDGNKEPGGQPKYSSRIENLSGYPAGVSGQRLTKDMYEQALRTGATSMLGVRVQKIEYDPKTDLKTITLSDGQVIQSRTVVVATGLESRKATFPGSDSNLITYNDGLHLKENGKGKDILIVGGSNGAAQAALGVSRSVKSATILSRSPIEKGMSDYQNEAVRAQPHKIKIMEGDGRGGHEIQEIRGNIVITKDGQQIRADMVGMFLGGDPNLSFLPPEIKKAANTPPTGIVNPSAPKKFVDINRSTMETSMPGVYAIGDARVDSGNRIGTAMGDGLIAVKSAHGYFERVRQQREKRKKS